MHIILIKIVFSTAYNKYYIKIDYNSKITETENIVSIGSIASWRDLDLHWPEEEDEIDETNTGNTIVFGNFGKDETK